MRSLTWQEVYARRLAVAGLATPAPREEAVRVAGEVCGVHAQLATGAELALSARVDGLTRRDVRDLLWDRRALVKAATLRTTLHLHPANELALWKSLRLRDERWREPWWLEGQGLTRSEAERLRERILAVLDDGEPRTRAEIGAAIRGRLGERIAADSWGQYLVPAADVVCHGPPRGRNVTFVRCDRWVRGWRARDPERAFREIARRYFEAYGPARRDELEHWLAQPVPAAALRELEEVDVEGHRSFVLPGTTFPSTAPAGVRLLWHYDVYVIGCHPRDHLIAEQKQRIFLRGAGPSPTLLVDGRVAGVWTRRARGRRMEIRVEPFRRLTRAQRQELAGDAARVARTYDAEPDLVVV